MNLSRRDVLRAGKAAGLVIAFRIPHALAAEPRVFVPNAWLKVTPSNEVTVLIWPAEMGQGVITSSVQLVAEELEVDPQKVKVELAPADRRYANPVMGLQMTGGSTSTRASWEPLRQAGATAREMLKAAAAERWSVQKAQLIAKNGVITHAESKRSATYGELAEAAASQRAGSVELKKAGFTVIGQSVPRLDARDKVTGQAQFGIDAKVRGLLTAVVVRCPVNGGT
ncbi:MAG: xanthine dehydrogenase family protein molybdopterin-binding subunit, partial [Myxococcaceae bacterium]|nr:xanthine dehydrogenase family protein molybdopterin-binding subunit [Myxococcaceae bacterium]